VKSKTKWIKLELPELILRDACLRSRNRGNCFGRVALYEPETNTATLVTCEHGGSMALCKECAEKLLGSALLEESFTIREQGADESIGELFGALLAKIFGWR